MMAQKKAAEEWARHRGPSKNSQVAFDILDRDNVGAEGDVWEEVARKLRGALMPPSSDPQPSPTTSLAGAATGPPGPSNGPGSITWPGVSGRVIVLDRGSARLPPEAVTVIDCPAGPPSGNSPVAKGASSTRSR